MNHPKLRIYDNAQGASDVPVQVRAFACRGTKPPHDHPHVYLNMGERDTIRCPYCSTLFCFKADQGQSSA